MDYRTTFYEEMEFSDVVFKVITEDMSDGNEDPVEVRAHKLILASVSPVFKAMFYGDLKEGDTVEIKDSTPEAFTNMIRYIYLQEFADTSIAILEDTMFLADKYMIEHLKEEIKKRVISTEITIHNLTDLLDFAEKYGKLYGLSVKCAMFLQCLKFEDIKFTPALWKYALKYNMNFGMTPENLFAALVKWARNQEPEKKLDREILLQFPLTSMKYQDLVKQVLPLNLLSNDEFVEIQKAKEKVDGGPWAQFLKPSGLWNTSELTLQASKIGHFTQLRVEPNTVMVLKYLQYHWSKSKGYDSCSGTLETHSNALIRFNDGSERQLKVEKFKDDLYRSSEPIYFRPNETCVFSVNKLLPYEIQTLKSSQLSKEEISKFCNSVELSKQKVNCSSCKCYIDEICFVKLDLREVSGPYQRTYRRIMETLLKELYSCI